MSPLSTAVMDVSGARVLVTGASSGIGMELARALVRRGVGEVVLVARRRNRLETLAAELARAGVTCDVDDLDLADETAIDGLLARHPQVDLLVNNAGFGSGFPILDVDPDTLCRLIDVNCRAVVRLTRGLLPGMVKRSFGGILLVGSAAGYVPMPAMAVYSASKAFIHSFTEGLRAEVERRGVRIHLLAPGPVESEFYGVARPGIRRPPARLFASPQAVAEAAVRAWLAGQPELVPGVLPRVGVAALQSLPGVLRRPVMEAAEKRAEAALEAGRRKPGTSSRD